MATSVATTMATSTGSPASSDRDDPSASVDVAARGSPYPAQPTTNEFMYYRYYEDDARDVAKRTDIHNAFYGDWAAAMQAAWNSLNNPNDRTFDRWFAPLPWGDGRPYVKSILEKLLYARTDGPVPQNIVAGFYNDAGDWLKRCSYYSDTPWHAYFEPPTGRSHICRGAFYLVPLRASDISCDELGNRVSFGSEELTVCPLADTRLAD